MSHTVTLREPVTLKMASAVTGRTERAIRELIREKKLQPRACLVTTRELVFELWQVEAALASRRPYRRVARDCPSISVP